jgi:hypothetical protein
MAFRFGRFGLTRPEDPPPILIRPKGNVHLIEETPSGEVFLVPAEEHP